MFNGILCLLAEMGLLLPKTCPKHHLKHHYLKEFGIGKSLSNVASVLIEKFFVDAENRYLILIYFMLKKNKE